MRVLAVLVPVLALVLAALVPVPVPVPVLAAPVLVPLPAPPLHPSRSKSTKSKGTETGRCSGPAKVRARWPSAVSLCRIRSRAGGQTSVSPERLGARVKATAPP